MRDRLSSSLSNKLALVQRVLWFHRWEWVEDVRGGRGRPQVSLPQKHVGPPLKVLPDGECPPPLPLSLPPMLWASAPSAAVPLPPQGTPPDDVPVCLNICQNVKQNINLSTWQQWQSTSKLELLTDGVPSVARGTAARDFPFQPEEAVPHALPPCVDLALGEIKNCVKKGTVI